MDETAAEAVGDLVVLLVLGLLGEARAVGVGSGGSIADVGGAGRTLERDVDGGLERVGILFGDNRVGRVLPKAGEEGVRGVDVVVL